MRACVRVCVCVGGRHGGLCAYMSGCAKAITQSVGFTRAHAGGAEINVGGEGGGGIYMEGSHLGGCQASLGRRLQE